MRPVTTPDDKTIETWETAIEGTVWVWVYDRREDRYIKQSCGGTGSRRLHISRDDRKFNQEQTPVENRTLDPFTNGSLRLISAATRDDNLDMRYHFTDADLAEMFDIRDEQLFTEAATEIESELILRRLAAMSEKLGTLAQNAILTDLVRERYPIGGTQTSMRDVFAEQEKQAFTRI